jgi:hypothetical protein
METSPFLLIKFLQTQVLGMLRQFDMFDFEVDQRKLLVGIKQELADARLDIRDYELSETRAEQLGKAKAAKELLEEIRKHILTASEYNVFSAVDVAQLSAQLENIMSRLI